MWVRLVGEVVVVMERGGVENWLATVNAWREKQHTNIAGLGAFSRACVRLHEGTGGIIALPPAHEQQELACCGASSPGRTVPGAPPAPPAP